MADLEQIQNNIIDQIEKASHSVKTDGYSMSIGELVNLYRDGDIVLDPAYQRLFRWEDSQKTKLIESILIGIPIPEIFVSQNPDHTWHVVDGVQRLSTILQLVGVLKDYDPLVLDSCKYIPALEGQTWNTLPVEIQRSFRRAKLKLSIILAQSSDEAPYELFQRLNTGGTLLSGQEVRNCVMLMLDPKFFEVINKLKNYPNYLDCLTLKEEDLEQEEHMELILRMFIGFFNQVDFGEYGSINKIVLSDFIDKETVRLIKNADLEKFEDVFKRTFDKIKNCLGDDAFKKYNPADKKFRGAFNVSIFEMVTIGISSNIDNVEKLGNDVLKEKIIELHTQPEILASLGRGVRAIKRFKDVSEYSRDYFS